MANNALNPNPPKTPNKMEKTAMHQYVNDTLENNVKPVEYYLELEKKQLIEAYDSAYNNGVRNNNHKSEQYYKNKFNKQ